MAYDEKTGTADAIAIRVTIEAVMYVKPEHVETTFDMPLRPGQMSGDQHLDSLRKAAEKFYGQALEIALSYTRKDWERELRIPTEAHVQKVNSSLTIIPNSKFVNTLK